MKTDKRVLIVDDNEALCDGVRDYLEHEDFTVECANSGKEAVALSHGNRYDVALVDMKLPDTEGTELVKKMAEISPLMEFIHITAYATLNSAIEAAKQDRVVSYETKPIDMDRLLSILKQVFIRKRAQVEKESLAHILEESLNEVYIFSVGTFRFIHVNKGARLNLCYSMDELSNLTPLDLEPEFTAKSFEKMVEPLRTGEKRKIDFTTVHRRKDGSLYDVEVHLQLSTFQLEPSFVAIILDITERTKMVKELLKVQKLESLGKLAGGIAHDFNNALACILGNIALIKMTTAKESKAYERLIEAEKVALKAGSLTKQFLTFSKGGTAIMKAASIKDVLEESICFSMKGSSITCQNSIPYDLRLLELDEGQIGQVINNLIINARQAMPEGGIIRVKAENITIGDQDVPTMDAGDCVRITIQDQGVGIPGENIEKIFDPFFTTKEMESGLGLTSCFSIIKNHGGHIMVESEPGVGTTFSVYIPASTKETHIQEKREENPVMGKVLIMDDEELIRLTASAILKDLGYDVVLSGNGDEAIGFYYEAEDSGHPFDAVVLDLTIRGGMGGMETIKRLHEINPKVKALVSSGYSDAPVMSDFRKYGFSGVITKPYAMEDLNRALQGVIVG
ncbi:MAG: response regulator [Planctomycetes bacterium]|nr:response regulator [Planctomycetota bacterium]